MFCLYPIIYKSVCYTVVEPTTNVSHWFFGFTSFGLVAHRAVRPGGVRLYYQSQLRICTDIQISCGTFLANLISLGLATHDAVRPRDVLLTCVAKQLVEMVMLVILYRLKA